MVASIVLNKTGTIQILDDEGKEIENYNIVVGSFLHVGDGAKIAKGAVLAQWDPYNIPVLSEKGGSLVFKDMIPGVTVKRELDESSGRIATVVIEHKEDLNPAGRNPRRQEQAARRLLDSGRRADRGRPRATRSPPARSLAKTPRQASKTKDITGGLPRVAELFEARRPKDAAEMARIDGIVSFEGTVRGKRKLVVKNEETQQEEEHLIADRQAHHRAARRRGPQGPAPHRGRRGSARDPRDPRAGRALRVPDLARCRRSTACRA